MANLKRVDDVYHQLVKAVGAPQGVKYEFDWIGRTATIRFFPTDFSFDKSRFQQVHACELLCSRETDCITAKISFDCTTHLASEPELTSGEIAEKIQQSKAELREQEKEFVRAVAREHPFIYGTETFRSFGNERWPSLSTKFFFTRKEAEEAKRGYDFRVVVVETSTLSYPALAAGLPSLKVDPK